jgi:acetate kinase
MIALCINAGSSSCKVALYRREADAAPRRIAATSIGACSDAQTAFERIWESVGLSSSDRVAAIGHRIVFGGNRFFNPIAASDDVLHYLETLVPLEPLHLRTELDLVQAARRRFGSIPQILCFDTAFHQTIPHVAQRLPLPSGDPLLRRYGFHGLSYEYVASRLGAEAGRALVAHLGSGASLCAMYEGKSLDTTMGFSALGGLTMSSRPGDLDPGVLLRLLDTGYDRSSLSDLLYNRCGLLGVSGITGDARRLFEMSGEAAAAREAIDLFAYQLVKHAGALIAVLGGLDKLVFTGGMGENEPGIRSELCRQLHYAGCRIDERANAHNETVISQDKSAVEILVLPTNENAMIARHAFEEVEKIGPRALPNAFAREA